MKITFQDQLDQTDFEYLDNKLSSDNLATDSYSIDLMPEWLYQFSSPVITENLDMELTTELFNSELGVDTLTNINTTEIDEYEKVSSKISAIVAASGLLNDLEPEQREEFDKAIRRRPLIEDE